ncbi:hypothetical protein [Ktedonobacter racemifer]|uniref:hypothetical protein n=1 Tax=Ktedonobacter racemifer TaxID=363277 RepID=UPI0012FCA3D0|nr:hypothetical protein [Ktedonobacter racemifer]
MALRSLYGTIYHQGTVYQASAYAVPFLLELVQQEEVQERESILSLLADLARGDAYHRQHMRIYTDEEKHDPSFQKQLEEEVFEVDCTHQAVKDGIPLYLELLAHQEVKIRTNAIYLLSYFRSEAAQLVPQLSTRFQYERDQGVYACLLYSVGILIKDQSVAYPDAFHLLEQSLEKGETDPIRVAAAMALIRTGSRSFSSRVLDVILEAIMHPETVENVYKELPWVEDGFLFEAVISLSQLPSSFHHSLVDPRLIDFLETVRAQDEETLDQIALDLALDLHSEMGLDPHF